MEFDKIRTSQTQVIVLAGDLSGFSFSYSKGNTILVNEFIKRYYFIVNKLISLSGGEVIKFIGDGFLAIWPLTKANFDKNYYIAKLVEGVATKLSRLIRWTKLDLQISERLVLRQGLTIENNAIKLKFFQKQKCFNDYLGEMINFAFRIQNLAINYPYICIHKNFFDLLPKNELNKYEPIIIEDIELTNIFKGLPVEKSKIYSITSLSEEELNTMYEKMCKNVNEGLDEAEFAKSKVIEAEFLVEHSNKKQLFQHNKFEKAFHSKMRAFYKEGPVWLYNSFYKEWAFVKTMSIELYNLKQDIHNLENFIIKNSHKAKAFKKAK